jgi:hypothetical protein
MLGFGAMRKFPWAEAVSARTRKTYRLCEVMKGAAADDTAGVIGAKAPDADALADPSVSPGLRMRVVSARLYGGSFAQTVADEITAACDDGRLSLSVAAALLRAISPKNGQAGGYEVGDTRGGSAPLGNPPDDWGADRMGFGGPARRDVAPPSGEPGYLFPPDGKSRRALTLMKRRKPTRLERKCELIAVGPFDMAPDMAAIERQVAREFELGLLAA